MSPLTIESTTCPRCGASCAEAELCLRCAAEDLADELMPRAPTPAALPFPDIPGCTVLRFLSTGGMGELWLVQRHDDSTLLVVKLPNAAVVMQPGAAERFEGEAEILGSLDHPNILSLLDAGTAGDGRLYMATEFVDGSDLRRLLRAERLAPARALEIFGKVCAAVEHAHSRGVVHRDLKPGNILVAADGAVKVADFGLAKDTAIGTGDARTSAGDGLGTPYYLAPETLRDAVSADVRADVFSLGVLLYEMLTGSVPMGSFTPLSQRCGLRREWDAVLTSALKDDPSARMASVGELRAAVERLWAKEQRRSHWRTRRRMGIAAALLLGTGAGGAWVALRPKAAVRPSFPSPAAAAREAPWRNSLGMEFIPLPGNPGVLMAVYETRIADYEKFFGEESAARPAWRLSPDPRERGGSFGMQTLTVRGWRRTDAATFLHPGFPVTPAHPAVGILPHHAEYFCAWLTMKERLEGRLAPDQMYRMPTLAEWRDAAGLTDTGSAPEVAGNFAGPEARDADWPRPRPTGPAADDFPRTAPVEALLPNANGFYHLAGNAAEWVTLPPAASDDETGPEAVATGGSWSTPAGRWTEENGGDVARPRKRSSDNGFRCVLETAVK